MASLVFENVVKKIDQNIIVHDFNLEVKDKEFLVLVGPSGCGKSTTLRMVAGLEEITDGKIYIDDQVVNDTAPKDRDIAMVFQNYALYPHMSVYENMAFGLKLRKVPKREIDLMVRETARILEIEELLNRKPKTLSGGQRQRVALGRAIVREPKVFLMDEPLSNLDAKLRVQMRAEIAKLHRRLQIMTIYVTHDQTEAMTMGDRIVVMKDGYIQQADTPMNIYEHPQNTFVAGFIGGSPAMNFLEVKVIEEKGELWLEAQRIKLPVTEQRKKSLIPYVGKEIILGIRPTDICDGVLINSHQEWALDIIIDVFEPMGAEKLIYFTINGTSIVGRVENNSPARILEPYKVSFNMSKAHYFDKETQEAICI
jgi:multiple sugar transport system ATP-binding protein